MEYTAGQYGSQTCEMNKRGQIKHSVQDLARAWESSRCATCGHPLNEVMWKKCKDGCCTMEYTAGQYGSQICEMNKRGQIEHSVQDLARAWESSHCATCGHPLVEQRS